MECKLKLKTSDVIVLMYLYYMYIVYIYILCVLFNFKNMKIVHLQVSEIAKRHFVDKIGFYICLKYSSLMVP